MTTHLPMWYLGDIPAAVCDIATQEFESIAPKDASMGKAGERVAHEHRNTTVRFAPPAHWFSGVMFEHAMTGNSVCKWDYDISFHEAIQFAHYGVDQHYAWHTDTFPISGLDHDRKVSVVCLMNDPSEFEGGSFEMRLQQDYKVDLKKGSVVAFPSVLLHRVTPVTKGLRKSATMWLNGPRFR